MLNRLNCERNLLPVALDNSRVTGSNISIILNCDMPLVFAQLLKLLRCYLENVCHGNLIIRLIFSFFFSLHDGQRVPYICSVMLSLFLHPKVTQLRSSGSPFCMCSNRLSVLVDLRCLLIGQLVCGCNLVNQIQLASLDAAHGFVESCWC